MVEENISQEFRFKNTEEIKNYFIKKIVNLFSYGKKRILILYQNNHYITPHIRKTTSF